jgi:hypothetical protein
MNQGLCAPYMETEKLSQLRAKTDRQLLELLHSKLEAGLNFAALAETQYLDGDRSSAERSLECGNRVLHEVQSLLPVLTEKQRRDLDPKLDRLRYAIKRLSWFRESARTHAAASIL